MRILIPNIKINQVIFFGLANPANNTALPASPLYDEERSELYATYRPDAANALLDTPYDHEDLLGFALEGERASADPPPWDNVMASLHGGLVIAARLETALIRKLPVPAGLQAVLIHPSAETETRAARGVLKPQIPLHTAVEHSRRISAFTLGCATGDRDLIRAGLEDILIEPQRRFLLPELPAVKKAALSAGALGCSFSGSGPSVFAWAEDGDADAVEAAMLAAFAEAGRSDRLPSSGSNRSRPPDRPTTPVERGAFLSSGTVLQGMISLDDAVTARLESHGARFEVLIDPDAALAMKRGEFDGELEEVIAAEDVFEERGRRVDYLVGTTGPLTSAFDTATARAGVCRDFAHLGIAFCRAVNIPARFVSGYAYTLQPPDFHAVFEAWLGDRWYVFDPTRRIVPENLVRIGVGRDAADVSFALIFGPAQMTGMNVYAEAAQTITGPAHTSQSSAAVCSA